MEGGPNDTRICYSQEGAPPSKSGLGPTVGAASEPACTQETTGPLPKKGALLQSPEGAPLLTNPRINLLTGMPYTMEAEQRAIREIMETRKRLLEEEDEDEDEEEEETTMMKKKSPPRRTLKDLVAKKKTSGRASKKKPWKGSAKSSGEKKVPSKADSGWKHARGAGVWTPQVFSVGQGTITQILKGEPSTIMEDECSKRGRNRL